MTKIDLATLNSWYEFSNQSARKKHWEWFVIDQFLRGNHNVRGNPADNTLTFDRRTDSISFPINKIFSTFRAVRAFVTRHKPYIAVEPKNSSKEALDYARRANAILERDNQLNSFHHINKEWVYYGIKYGTGYRQVGYDPIKKCAVRWTVDPFDLLIGSKTGEMEDAPYIIKTVVRTIGYLKHKYPKYKDQIAPDNELAADEYKSLSLQIQYQDSYGTAATTLDEQTAIVKECWYRLYEPNKKGGLINKCTFIDNVILDKEETPYTEYPFIAYKADITPNEAFAEGHLKHVISPQRLLNLLNTQMIEYNHIVNRGRILKPKNAGFRVINAKEGQIIEYKQGKKPEVLAPPAINPMLERQLSLTLEFIEDLGGQHDASMGATPARVTSGKAIEALQTGDSNNISDLRDNFEDSLTKEAVWILKLYSMFEKDGVVINKELPDGTTDTFGAIGAEAYKKTGAKIPEKFYMEDNGDYCDVCMILADNQVKVSVSSELGETREAKTELLLRLVELGLPLKFLLEHLEFPNTSDILQRIGEEAVADMAMDAMKAQTTQPPVPGMISPNGVMSPGTPPEGGIPMPDTTVDELEALRAELEGN